MSVHIAIIENNIIASNTIREKLTRTLIEKGYRVSILSTGAAINLQRAKENGFHVIDVRGSTQNPMDIFSYIRSVYRALKYNQVDICLTFTIRPAIWGNLVTRLLHIPTITNITGIGPLFERNNFAYRAARILYRFVLQKTTLIFFQNETDRRVFIEKEFIKPTQAAVIPGSGIDHEKFKPLPARPADNQFVFLFISRLVKDKGILEYVRAAETLKNAWPAMRCKVLGPVWNQNLKDNTITEKDLQQWQQNAVIEYLGNTDDVRPMIAEADCIVLPSYREGSSNVLLEASSMEKPCITTDTTGCREIVEDGVTGFLCKVKDATDLANTMERMMKIPELERIEMGKRGRQKVIREFDKQLVIDAYLKAIDSIKL